MKYLWWTPHQGSWNGSYRWKALYLQSMWCQIQGIILFEKTLENTQWRKTIWVQDLWSKIQWIRLELSKKWVANSQLSFFQMLHKHPKLSISCKGLRKRGVFPCRLFTSILLKHTSLWALLSKPIFWIHHSLSKYV